MKKDKEVWRIVLLALGFGAFVLLVPLTHLSEAQSRAPQAANPAVPGDELQRSYQIDSYHLVSNNGAARGETLYFYKCWMCHNQYTIQAEYGNKAPFLHLKDLYKQTKLVTGQSVNDATITDQIKNGSAGMPSFTTDMSDADVADLVSYLKSGRCCVEGENPPANPWYRAETHPWSVPKSTSGGPRGKVRIPSGETPEGIMVQLIAPNGARTTVYAQEDGSFEFPTMQTGDYTLRIAKPLEYKPYHRDGVRIDGATRLPEIVLERIVRGEDLPAAKEVLSQLSGVEMLWNLQGSNFEKVAFNRSCGCHSYQQALRNRFDERTWRLILHRMMHYSGAPLINPEPGRNETTKDEEVLAKFLTRVRGPDSVDMPVRPFPRPHGAATRVVITEFELPRVLLSPHDVHGDSQGNIWYTSHKTQFMGKLDPGTGVVTEYKVPLIAGALPGTHRVWVDKNDIVWLSENWAHRLTRLDPKTGKFNQMVIEEARPINTPGFSNFAMAPDGTVFHTDRGPEGKGGTLTQYDPSSGSARVVKQWPLSKVTTTYDSTISADGNYWAGGSPAGNGNSIEMLDIRTGKMLELDTGAHESISARGGFDPSGNPWFGGRGGNLVMLDFKVGRLREYVAPLPYYPYNRYYEAMPDKNGEVWAGVNFGGSFVRLDPKTERWIEYVMPEPFSFDRRTWIDNSTNPVTVWYVDYNGYIVRIQPLQ